MSGRYPLNGSYFTEADDIEMIATPTDWPPGFLHVKRGSPADEFGIVQAVGFEARRIYTRAKDDGTPGRALDYANAAAVVADGWIVD